MQTIIADMATPVDWSAVARRPPRTASEFEQQFIDMMAEHRIRWLREQYERASFLLYRRLGFWWRVDILPALESWDPTLAWVHDHPGICVGAYFS